MIRDNVPVLLQIATFFSNNLDFFTSSGYSPRGSTVALNPLQAESMLVNKKKAAAYIHAIKKVSICLNMLGIPRSQLVTKGDRAFAVKAPRVQNTLSSDITKKSSVTSFKLLLKTFFYERVFVNISYVPFVFILPLF